MRPEIKVMAKIDTLMEVLTRDEQRSVAFHVHRTYGGPMSATERSQRFRSRAGNETVAPVRNETVSISQEVAVGLASSENGNGSKKQQLLEATEVLQFLNRKALRSFRAKPATLKPILARLNDGASIEDCKVVIGRKLAEWKGTEQEKYLRPKTLFAAENFENYIGQARPS